MTEDELSAPPTRSTCRARRPSRKLNTILVEQRRLLEIEEMSDPRQHAQRGVGDRALEEQVRLQARRVLVAGDEERRHLQSAQPVLEMPQRRTRRENSAQRHRHAGHRMLGELLRKATPTRLVLRAQALRVAAFGQLTGKRRHADGLGVIRLATQIDSVLRLLIRLGAVSDAGHHERAREVSITQAEMQRRESAHRQSDDVRRSVRDGAHHVGEIVGGAVLAVGADIGRNGRRRIAARAIDRAAKVAGEIADLRIPAPRIAGEFVNEDQRRAAPGRAHVELDSIRRDDGHDHIRARRAQAACRIRAAVKA